MPHSNDCIYYPDDHMFFMSYAEVRTAIVQMRRVYDHLGHQGIVGERAFYESYMEAMPKDPNGRLPGRELGVEGMREMLKGNVKLLRRYLVTLASQDPLNQHAAQLELHKDLERANEPLKLFLIATEHKKNGSALNARKCQDAMTLLVLAMQMMRIELNDPQDGIDQDLEAITALEKERLFFTNDSREVYVVADLNDKNAYRVRSLQLFLSARDAERAVVEVRKGWRSMDEERRLKQRLFRTPSPITVRVVHNVSTRNSPEPVSLAVWLKPSVKMEEHTIGKYERYEDEIASGVRKPEDASMKDRRRWGYVVFGRLEGDEIIPATDEDLQKFSDYTREHLWAPPLQEIPDDTGDNQYSSAEFRDVKTVGRYYRPELSPMRTVAGLCEQQCISIVHYVCMKCTTGDERHDLYALRKLLVHCCGKWWPDAEGMEWGSDRFRNSLIWHTRQRLDHGEA